MDSLQIFNPAYPSFFLHLAQRKVHIFLILTRNVFEKVKKEHGDILKLFLECNNTSMRVLDDDIKLAFVITDTFLSLSLFFKNGTFDTHKDLVSFDKSALKWGENFSNTMKNTPRNKEFMNSRRLISVVDSPSTKNSRISFLVFDSASVATE